ncbi:MAG: MFS transporter [Hyphomicrobiales bacterium]|nr:MAG: MFS transporter [Hyphomicrobiales bacterium]
MTNPSPTRDATAGATSARRRRVALASFIGSTVEYYDFILYSVAAALVFPQLFFPNLSPLVGTVASFGTLAAGYFARPVGAIVCGHFGDRIGRKSMLMMTMITMGVGSVLIGLLPTYATIGVAAPLLLVMLRILQGFAVGGEWGGSVLIAVEHAAPKRVGLFGGFTQVGVAVGGLLSTGVMSMMSLLPDEQFMTWGWRVPFLLSAVLVVIGIFIRVRVEESPEFEAVKKSETIAASPLKIVLTTRLGTLVNAIFIGFGILAVHSVLSTYMLSYAKQIGFETTTVHNLKVLMTGTSIVGVLFCAWLSDVVGKHRLMLVGALLFVVLPFPFFKMVNSGSVVLLAVALVVMFALVLPLVFAPLAGLFTEMFPVRARYTGVAVSYQTASVLGGGLAPIIASTLVAAAGGGTNSQYLALFMMGTALVTAVAIVHHWRSRTSGTRSGEGLSTPQFTGVTAGDR